jgi:hypothetical protein
MKEDWEHETAYKIVDLYVKELIERHERKILDLEGLVEAYLYVLGRLKASDAEVKKICDEIKKQMITSPESPEKTGMSAAMGDKKLSAGLLKALEGL